VRTVKSDRAHVMAAFRVHTLADLVAWRWNSAKHQPLIARVAAERRMASA
jgi:hypothetical protein